MTSSLSYPKRCFSLQIDVVAALTLYVFLLMAIPSSLVFAPLGGNGGPASVLAVLFMGWYLIIRLHPTFDIGTDRQPIRTAAVQLCACILYRSQFVSSVRHCSKRS